MVSFQNWKYAFRFVPWLGTWHYPVFKVLNYSVWLFGLLFVITEFEYLDPMLLLAAFSFHAQIHCDIATVVGNISVFYKYILIISMPFSKLSEYDFHLISQIVNCCI